MGGILALTRKTESCEPLSIKGLRPFVRCDSWTNRPDRRITPTISFVPFGAHRLFDYQAAFQTAVEQ